MNTKYIWLDGFTAVLCDDCSLYWDELPDATERTETEERCDDCAGTTPDPIE